jgi:hypothetical protein
MDLHLLERVIESSPVIVLIVIAANVFLWRKVEAKDEALMRLFEKNSQALAHVTTSVDSMAQAVRELRHAIERGEHR